MQLELTAVELFAYFWGQIPQGFWGHQVFRVASGVRTEENQLVFPASIYCFSELYIPMVEFLIYKFGERLAITTD